VSAPDVPDHLTGDATGGAPADGADDPRHPERALAADHALGLLDPAERVAYEAHLAGCAACRAEVRAYAETAALLADALPPVAPPPGLRARILAEARADARVDAGAPSGGPSGGPSDGPSGPRLVRDAVPTGAPRRAGWSLRAPWLAAAASLALAVGLGAGWARERTARLALARASAEAGASAGARLGSPGDRVVARDTVRALLAARDSTIAALDSLVTTLTEDDVRTARLTATGDPEAMRLTWNRRRGVVVVTAARLASPDSGRVYQLWGIARGGAPQSLGVFRPSGGALRVVLPVPPGAAMDVAAVTVEPAGGSVRPSGPPVMSGTIGAD
jgi:anti-sigma-K factor RskA